jgi:hypothetical protein
MARYSCSFANQTAVATADTTALTTLKFMALQGGSGTMQLKVNEVQSGGESSSANVISYSFGRDSTVGTATLSLSGAYNALLDATATAPGTVAAAYNTTTGTFPQRSSTLGHLIIHDYNAYGGLARWQARQGEEITVYGASATGGELSYSGFSNCAAGIIGGHIIYELV